jgi:hypothetical protein
MRGPGCVIAGGSLRGGVQCGLSGTSADLQMKARAWRDHLSSVRAGSTPFSARTRSRSSARGVLVAQSRSSVRFPAHGPLALP